MRTVGVKWIDVKVQGNFQFNTEEQGKEEHLCECDTHFGRRMSLNMIL
jgi:hypothetical protein